MTDNALDIWLDSAGYDNETLLHLKERLINELRVPSEQAEVLINGNSHRIKRSCSSEDSEHLVKQFSAWGINLRIEPSVLGKPAPSTPPHTSQDKVALTLAPHGDTIPNLAGEKTAPTVKTDHLHLAER
jgi:hypothetical protein